MQPIDSIPSKTAMIERQESILTMHRQCIDQTKTQAFVIVKSTMMTQRDQ